MGDYADFLAGKRQTSRGAVVEDVWFSDRMYGFQRHLTEFAVTQGRSSIFADCGMGKSLVELVWAENIRKLTGKPVLIIAPLAVSFQTVREAAKFDLDAENSRDGSIPAGITVTNYERLERFNTDDFGGVVCDESSVLKSYSGSRRALVTEFLRTQQYRLLCTATAAPNDYIELGTSSEALGELGYMDMLNRFFVNDRNTSAVNRYRGQMAAWRFKGHAEDAFWRWVASWARAARKPSDLGFPDDGFILPHLSHRLHVVTAETPLEGTLFDVPARGLREERDEARRTLTERCEVAAHQIADADRAISWCHLNDEGRLLTRLIEGAVEVAGSQSPDEKEEKLVAFINNEIRVLVTKPSVAGFGLNLQNCHRMTFFPSHSWEMYYQSVRRCWRFGQTDPVIVDIVASEGGRNVLRNLERKAAQADRMFESLVRCMNDGLSVTPGTNYPVPVEAPQWVS